MKIDSQLPNLFDQYDVEENRVTNALLQTLASSPSLTKAFLKRFISRNITRDVNSVAIWTQRAPKDKKTDKEVQDKRDRVPDGWFMLQRKDGTLSSVVVLESKIYKKHTNIKQLRGHLRKANRYEGDRIWALLVTPDSRKPFPKWEPENGVYVWCNWREVHSFVRTQMEKFEKGSLQLRLLRDLKGFIEMKEIGGFEGIDFSEGYDPLRARKILKKLIAEIDSEIDSDVRKKYPKLTEHKGNVQDPWDVFAPDVKGGFTHANHFALAIRESYFDIMLTLPNNFAKGWQRLRQILTTPKLMHRFRLILSHLRQKLPNLRVVFAHRHFNGYNIAFYDCRIDVDLDTTNFARKADGDTMVKRNPKFFDSFLSAVLDTPASVNRELNVRAKFYYDELPEAQNAKFKHTVINALAAFKPLYEFLEPRLEKRRR
jgi:hypothetical protein